jgi:putative transcriptional regulator
MNADRLDELAALHAAGALEGSELEEFQTLLKGAGPAAKATLSEFNNLGALLAAARSPLRRPSPGLKERILHQVAASEYLKNLSAQLQKLLPPAVGGFAFVSQAADSGWQKLAVPGAYVKLLSCDMTRGYAVVLGKLDPGARYPRHRHAEPEEVYVLSGDLHIGERVLNAGDFHRAEAGTTHGVNYSEAGCTILAVLSTQDLVAQFAGS